MSKLLTARNAKLRVIDLLKDLLRELSFSAMSQSDIDLIAKALFTLRQNGKPLDAQMQFLTGKDDRVRVVINLSNGPGHTTIQ